MYLSSCRRGALSVRPYKLLVRRRERRRAAVESELVPLQRRHDRSGKTAHIFLGHCDRHAAVFEHRYEVIHVDLALNESDLLQASLWRAGYLKVDEILSHGVVACRCGCLSHLAVELVAFDVFMCALGNLVVQIG